MSILVKGKTNTWNLILVDLTIQRVTRLLHKERGAIVSYHLNPVPKFITPKF